MEWEQGELQYGMAKIQKTAVSIMGQSVQVDTFFLNALSMHHFNQPYSEKTIRSQTNKLLRELLADIKESPVHPQVIYQRILQHLVQADLHLS